MAKKPHCMGLYGVNQSVGSPDETLARRIIRLILIVEVGAVCGELVSAVIHQRNGCGKTKSKSFVIE